MAPQSQRAAGKASDVCAVSYVETQTSRGITEVDPNHPPATGAADDAPRRSSMRMPASLVCQAASGLTAVARGEEPPVHLRLEPPNRRRFDLLLVEQARQELIGGAGSSWRGLRHRQSGRRRRSQRICPLWFTSSSMTWNHLK